jgi:hypothetical protein
MAPPAPRTSTSSASTPGSSTPLPNDGIDRSDWDPNFVEVYAYLASKNWGEEWKGLLTHLIHYEWSHYFEDDISKIERIKERPAEIATWMKKH